MYYVFDFIGYSDWSLAQEATKYFHNSYVLHQSTLEKFQGNWQLYALTSGNKAKLIEQCAGPTLTIMTRLKGYLMYSKAGLLNVM